MSDLTPDEKAKWCRHVRGNDGKCEHCKSVIPETPMPSPLDRLDTAQIASCSCNTKPPDIEWHAGTCHYRLFSEAQAEIERLNRENARNLELLRIAEAKAIPPEPKGRRWTLLLTGNKNGVVGGEHDTFGNHPEHYERVKVVECTPNETRAPQWCECADTPERYRNVCVKCGKAPMPTLIDYNAPSETNGQHWGLSRHKENCACREAQADGMQNWSSLCDCGAASNTEGSQS